MKDQDSRQRAEAEVRGTTLRVYWYIFKSQGSVGVREVQRVCGLASPSTALHHLEKLRELGVVQKDEYGQYHLVEQVKVGTLRLFMKFGWLVLPRYLFYAVFFSVSLTLYLLGSFWFSLAPNVMALLFGLSASAASMYETIRIWKEKLF
jgi:DNA-binding transcriptional ArsR family regulator